MPSALYFKPALLMGRPARSAASQMVKRTMMWSRENPLPAWHLRYSPDFEKRRTAHALCWASPLLDHAYAAPIAAWSLKLCPTTWGTIRGWKGDVQFRNRIYIFYRSKKVRGLLKCKNLQERIYMILCRRVPLIRIRESGFLSRLKGFILWRTSQPRRSLP